MDSSSSLLVAKDMIKKYTQEYALDEPTRVRSEELYKEFMTKHP